MRPLLLFKEEMIVGKFATREEYWRAHGREDVAREVGQRTVVSLQKRGIRPDPKSAVYKKEFDRLSGIYRDEAAARMKLRRAQEAAWIEQHQNDSDEELLAYVRETVRRPEQYEKPSRIPGGTRIAAHFGGWQKTLVLAGLLQPKPEG